MSKDELKIAKEIRKTNDRVYAEVEKIRRDLDARIQLHVGRASWAIKKGAGGVNLVIKH